jgi:sulfite exporter TauE/SafE
VRQAGIIFLITQSLSTRFSHLMELWSAFILGLVGSLHCAGMCGPLALALPRSRTARRTFLLGRLAYNAGRVSTYIILGILFGFFGKGFSLAGAQRFLSIGFGTLILATLFCSRKRTMSVLLGRVVSSVKRPISHFLKTPTFSSLLMLGSLNGLLPCGLVYAASAMAGTLGNPLAAGAFMLLFGLGTAPMMLAIALSGKPFQLSLRLRLQPLIPLTLFLLGSLLILRGLSLGIPYLSPNLSGDQIQGVHCH